MKIFSIEKGFQGKRPKTTLRITEDGAARLASQAETLRRFLALIADRPVRQRGKNKDFRP